MHNLSPMKYRWRDAMPWLVLPLCATYVGVRLLSTGWDGGTSRALTCLIALVAACIVTSPRSAWLAGAALRPSADPATVDPAAYIQSRGL